MPSWEFTGKTSQTERNLPIVKNQFVEICEMDKGFLYHTAPFPRGPKETEYMIAILSE